MPEATNTHIGTVSLNVLDPDRMREFYERSIGLETLEDDNGVVQLGLSGERPLIELVHRPDAQPRPPHTTGLFHLAVLVPDRNALAHSLARAVGTGSKLAGASDHLVSEAIYLADPEGNGVEIYHDRPRASWADDGGPIKMDSLPLDLQQLLAEIETEPETTANVSAGTTIGHVHLQVSDLSEAERFYAGELGLDVTVRDYPGALFLSSGGYHHHIGLNTWSSAGAPPAPENSTGLNYFELVTPSKREPEELYDPTRNKIKIVNS